MLILQFLLMLQSLENVPYQRQSQNLWENVQQKLSKVRQEEESSKDDSREASGTRQAFLGDPFQEMTYEEIAIWIDTRARYVGFGPPFKDFKQEGQLYSYFHPNKKKINVESIGPPSLY